MGKFIFKGMFSPNEKVSLLPLVVKCLNVFLNVTYYIL